MLDVGQVCRRLGQSCKEMRVRKQKTEQVSKRWRRKRGFEHETRAREARATVHF